MWIREAGNQEEQNPQRIEESFPSRTITHTAIRYSRDAFRFRNRGRCEDADYKDTSLALVRLQ